MKRRRSQEEPLQQRIRVYGIQGVRMPTRPEPDRQEQSSGSGVLPCFRASIQARPPVAPNINRVAGFVVALLKRAKLNRSASLRSASRFPRGHRHSIGERIAARSLDLHEALLDAASSSAKRTPLERAGRYINLLPHLIRMAKDLQLLPPESYGHASDCLEEIGRMTGGWRKSAP